MSPSLLFILGTSGELIKTLPLILEADARGRDWRVVSTGQSGVNFLKQWQAFGLGEDHLTWALPSQLDLNSSTQALKWFTKAWRLNLRPFDQLQNCSRIIVHGDTLSTLIGAHWAKRVRKPLAHVEAGLRSKSIFSPFPEEICRRLVSRWADMHFAPDQWSMNNLKTARVSGKRINTQGNTMKDALGRVLTGSTPAQLPRGAYVLANIHRFENLNSKRRWQTIKNCLFQAAKEQPVYLVLHPSTHAKIKAVSLEAEMEDKGVKLVPRMMFSEFAHWLRDCRYLLTDGGSNQEECFYIGKPCLILRETTERNEGLGENCILSKLEAGVINAFLRQPESYIRPEQSFDFRTSKLILDHLTEPM